MLNPWVLLAIVLAFVGVGAGAYHAGGVHKENAMVAAQKRDDDIERRVTDAALKSAAEAIAKIQVRNVTNKQTLQKEIVHVPDYSQCHNSADGLRAINDALTNGKQPTSDSRMPGPSPTK